MKVMATDTQSSIHVASISLKLLQRDDCYQHSCINGACKDDTPYDSQHTCTCTATWFGPACANTKEPFALASSKVTATATAYLGEYGEIVPFNASAIVYTHVVGQVSYSIRGHPDWILLSTKAHRLCPLTFPFPPHISVYYMGSFASHVCSSIHIP